MNQGAPRPFLDVIARPTEWTGDPRRPPVVIAIPNWNRGELLRDCVESILQLTAYPRYRVCIYDQGSTDSSRDHIRVWSTRVDAILAPENVGYIPANNAVMDRYPEWDVVLLNNDTRVVDPMWLDTLVSTAYSADDIGLVGAKLVYPDGRLQEAGSQLFRNGSARAYGKFEDPAHAAFNIRREVDFCSAACLYVKRSVLHACGGFDSCYIPCYYEDVDLALKARAAGYRTIYEPGVTVVHKEYGTSGTAFATDQMIRNRDILLGRWQESLNRHPLSLWEIPVRDTRQQVLLVGDATDRVAPDRVRRSTQLLQALAGSYAVAYAHTDPATADECLRVADDWDVTTFYPGFARAVGSPDMDLAAIVAHNRFRWVIFDSPRAAAGWLGVIRRYATGFRVAIDAALEDAVECAAVAGADVVLAGSGAQRDAIRRKCPRVPVAILSAAKQNDREPGRLGPALGRILAIVRGRAATMMEILARFEREAS
jgi:GT2 family glycosyltransferase